MDNFVDGHPVKEHSTDIVQTSGGEKKTRMTKSSLTKEVSNRRVDDSTWRVGGLTACASKSLSRRLWWW